MGLAVHRRAEPREERLRRSNRSHAAGCPPERTVYQITEAGRRELVEWTRELISEPETEHTRFVAGLSVVIVLAPDDAIALLRQRVARLSEQIEAQRAVVAEAAEVPRLFLIEDEYRIAMAVAEAEWTRSLVDDLSSGTFPMLDAWRKFHETGPSRRTHRAGATRHGERARGGTMPAAHTALVIGGGIAGPVAATALPWPASTQACTRPDPDPAAANGIGGSLALEPNGLAALQTSTLPRGPRRRTRSPIQCRSPASRGTRFLARRASRHGS